MRKGLVAKSIFSARLYTRDRMVNGIKEQAGKIQVYRHGSIYVLPGATSDWPPTYIKDLDLLMLTSYVSHEHAEFLMKEGFKRWKELNE